LYYKKNKIKKKKGYCLAISRLVNIHALFPH
jgi:hypothetical protein